LFGLSYFDAKVLMCLFKIVVAITG